MKLSWLPAASMRPLGLNFTSDSSSRQSRRQPTSVRLWLREEAKDEEEEEEEGSAREKAAPEPWDCF